MRVAVIITGASGIIYGVRLVDVLASMNHEVYVVLTKPALTVIKHECLCTDNLIKYLKGRSKEVFFDEDLSSPLSSSSFILDVVFVAPCSLRTLSDIANSRQDNLATRVACNALRLRRKLVLLIRETPLSTLDIYNMLKASIAGAIILPACPAFYTCHSSVEEIIDFIVGKALDAAGISNDLYKRWSGSTPGTPLCARLFCSEDSAPSR